jgi:hypothetical protein
MAWILLTPAGMRPSRASSTAAALVVLVLGAAGAASCGSVTPLAPDGGAAGTRGTGGSTTSGAAGAAAGTTGSAGAAAGTTGSAGSTQDGGAGAAGGSTNVDAPVERAPGCPANPTAPTGACTPSQVCEYRAPDARPTCVTRLECYASGAGAQPSWHITPPDPTCGTRPASCPQTYATVAQGALCSAQGATSCDYDEGRCSCFPCSLPNGGNTQSSWACRAWDSGGQGCPAVSPLAGTACATANQFCTYGGLCSVSVGENFQCTGGFWQRMLSPTGSCALRMCPTTNVDAGADHPADTCGQAAACPAGSTCWQQLDGASACVKPVPTPTLSSCQTGDPTCCLKDTDCTQPNNGRCLPLFNVKENFCGGAVPFGNVCRYDQCRADTDCKAQAPAGATVSTCVPSGAFGLFNATCVHGACRTDADCGLHPGGRCQYGLAATNGVCSLRNVLYCAYPSDPCQVGSNGSTGCTQGKICVPTSSYQGRECGAPPPAFP